MRAGRLRAKIEFLRQQEVKDEYGEKSTEYETIAFRWGDSFGQLVGEDEERHGKSGYITQKFRVRYDSVINSVRFSDQIRYNGAIYGIIAIENKDNRNKELVFTGAHNERFA